MPPGVTVEMRAAAYAREELKRLDVEMEQLSRVVQSHPKTIMDGGDPVAALLELFEEALLRAIGSAFRIGYGAGLSESVGRVRR